MNTNKLDVLLCNGTVYTMKSKGDTAEAIGFKDGRIAFVGTNKEAEEQESDRRLDLKGAVVLPGFNDSHMHLYAYCENQTFVDLEKAESIEEVCRLMSERARVTPKGTWIRGANFDQGRFAENRIPDRHDLDRISTEHPILLHRCCLHAVTVNSKALSESGLDDSYTPPAGGIAERDADGHLTGIFKEDAVKMFDDIIPAPLSDPAVRDKMMREAIEKLHSEGLTGIHTYAERLGKYADHIEFYQDLEKKGELGVRVALSRLDLFDKENITEEAHNDPHRLVQQGSYKLFTDGSLGSRSAALLEDYSDDPGNNGFLVCTQEELNEKVLTAYRRGLQPAVHAIGDRGVDSALASFEYALNAERAAGIADEELRKRLPFRLIHAQILNDSLIERMKKLPLLVDIQPVFLNTDWLWVKDRIGEARNNGAYAWNTLHNAGLRLAGGSDCPVEQFNPIYGIYTAVARKGLNGQPAGGYRPEEAMDRFDAAALYTTNAHYATGQQDVLGILEPGRFADAVVLDRDIFTVPEEDILRTKVTHTFVAGKLVYGTL